MVKIAMIGGSGSGFSISLYILVCNVTNGLLDVAQEIIDVLVASNKHEILLLSRKVRMQQVHKSTAGSLQLTSRHRTHLLAGPPRM